MSQGHITHPAPVEDAMGWIAKAVYVVIAAVFIGAGQFVWSLL